MSLRKTLADVFIGAAYQVGAPAVLPVKVTRKTITENNGREQETTEEFRRYSVIGGTIRAFISSLLVRKALSIYREPPEPRVTQSTPSPPPADVYDFHNIYVRRT